MQSKVWESYHFGIPIIPVLILAFLLRGILVFDLFGYIYPSGADYGQHIFYAEQYIQNGRLPDAIPNFQLGRTQWATLPGGSLTFALFSTFSGLPPFETTSSILVYGLIEVAGVYFLSWHIFRSLPTAFTASLIAALLPIDPQMMSWGNYPNIIALAFIPWILLAWLDYWETPNLSKLLVAVLLIVGALSIHHLTAIWIVLTLVIFSALQLLTKPTNSIKKLLPIGIIGLAVGLPVLLRLIKVWSAIGSTNILGTTVRYDMTRISWPIWSDLTTPLGLLFVGAGLWLFFWKRVIQPSTKTLIASYLMVSLLFGFGWIFGLKFYYTRSIYYFGIPIVLGCAVFTHQWRKLTWRILFTAILVASLGGIAVTRAIHYRHQLQALTPDAVNAAYWLEQHSEPNDIVVIGTLLGFQFPRLLNRPQMIALPPDLIGNPQEFESAGAAVSILTGDPKTEAILEQWPIRYVLVNKNVSDRPDPLQSRNLLNKNPRFRLVFENSSVLIYQVERDSEIF